MIRITVRHATMLFVSQQYSLAQRGIAGKQVIFWLVYPKTLGIKNLQAYDVLLIENICCAYTSLRIRVILPASMIGRVYWQK